jgi:hypothetical protein
MVDGLGELEKRGKEGGTMAVAKCMPHLLVLLWMTANARQILRTCRIGKLECLRAMNGERRIHGSYTLR